MPSDRRVHCRVCGGHSSEVGSISWAGRCTDCGHDRFERNLDQLVEGAGEFAIHHARRLELSARKRRLAVERASA